MIKTTAIALAAASILSLAGCYSIGGVPASRDRFVYESHPLLPATVSVLDTRSGETVWSMDVPVGQQLTFRFYDKRTPRDSTGTRPAMMRWQVTDLGESADSLPNEFAVPLASARKINYEIRQGPEYADDSAAAGRPDPTTTTVSPRSNSTPPAAPSEPRSGNNGTPELDPVISDD